MRSKDKLIEQYKTEYNRYETYIGSINGISFVKRATLQDAIKGELLSMQEEGAAITEFYRRDTLSKIQEERQQTGKLSLLFNIVFKYIMSVCALGCVYCLLDRHAPMNGVFLFLTGAGFCIIEYVSNKYIVKRIESGRVVMSSSLRILFLSILYVAMAFGVAIFAERFFPDATITFYRIGMTGGILLYFAFLRGIWNLSNGQKEETEEHAVSESIKKLYNKKKLRAVKRGNSFEMEQFVEKQKKAERNYQWLFRICLLILVVEEILSAALLLVFAEADGLLITAFIFLGVAVIMIKIVLEAGKLREQALTIFAEQGKEIRYEQQER